MNRSYFITIGLRVLMVTLLLKQFATPTLAVDWTKQADEENTLKIHGTCSSESVTVYLYDKHKQEVVYSAGTKCENGTFAMNDYVAQWNIKDDIYTIVVGEGQKRPDFSKTADIEIKQHTSTTKTVRDIDILQESAASIEIASDAADIFQEAQDNFSTHLQGLTDSLDDMKQSLSSTHYPEAVKSALTGTFSIIEDMLAKLKELVLVVEKQIVDPAPFISPVMQEVPAVSGSAAKKMNIASESAKIEASSSAQVE